MSIHQEWLKFLRDQYPVGSRIKLREMGSDDPCPIKPGSMGSLQYIDDLGTFHVAWDDGCGLGLVIGQDSFSVSPPPLQTLKLYMPMTATYYDEDDPEQDITMDSREAAQYAPQIINALQSERRWLENEDPEEAERGLMAYFDGSDAVNEKVVSFFPSVEEVDGRLYGVAVRQLKEALTPGEMAELKEYCSCQYADGWGEGYEQRPRRTSYGELYVSFWQAKDFFILTKEEMETSRAASRPPHQPKRGGDAR